LFTLAAVFGALEREITLPCAEQSRARATVKGVRQNLKLLLRRQA
jgi:hypothetical protein